MPEILGLPLKDFFIVWGAGLSTLLAILKLVEFWRDRFRLEVDYDFSTDPHEGNRIVVRNLTARPITIPYRELLMRRRWAVLRKREEIPLTDEQPCDVSIPAHASHTFEFKEQSHFSLKSKLLAGKTIYLRVWLAGRRPITLKVYTNGA